MENRFLALETTLKKRKKLRHQNGAFVNVDRTVAQSLSRLQGKSSSNISKGLNKTPVTDFMYLPICGRVQNKDGKPIPEIRVFFKDVSDTLTGEFLDIQPVVVRSTTNAKGEFCLAIKLQDLKINEGKRVCLALEGRPEIQKMEIMSVEKAKDKLSDIAPGKPLAQILKKLGIPVEALKKNEVKYIALGKLYWD